MDLGKYASGKLTIEAILDKFFMDGFLDTNEIQKIGDMLKALSNHSSDVILKKSAKKPKANNDLPDEFSFAKLCVPNSLSL